MYQSESRTKQLYIFTYEEKQIEFKKVVVPRLDVAAFFICSRTERFSERDHKMQISFVSAFLVLLARVRPRRYLYRPAILNCQRQIGFHQKPASQAISWRAARIINNKNANIWLHA